MSCDENSFKRNKQTSSSEVRTKTASFMYKSSILVAWINDGKPSFLLWLRLRRLVVSGEGIWGCSWCNSAMDFFWVVKLPRLYNGQLWRVFSFKIIPFNGTLYEFKGFQPVSIFVSFCDLGVELYIPDLVKFLPRRLLQDIFFKMAGSGLAPASEDVRSLTALLSGSKDYVRLFTATELRSCNYREPLNMYLLEMTMNLLLCFVCLCFTGLGIIRILSRCWIKKRQNIRQSGHWMLDTSYKVGLQP